MTVYRCADRGGLRCPCALIEAGQCYTCAMSRKGKCDCSLDWQGVCPYNEFLQSGGAADKTAERRLPAESAMTAERRLPAEFAMTAESRLTAEFEADVVNIKEYSDKLAVVRLAVSKGFSHRCARAGSFITASAFGCRTPLSVLRTGWGWIETAVQPAGPKTMELMRLARGDGYAPAAGFSGGGGSAVGDTAHGGNIAVPTAAAHGGKWKIAGPFEAGLLNRERLNRDEALTVIAKGTAIAPFINMKEGFYGEMTVRLLVDDDKLTEDFLGDYLRRLSEGRREFPEGRRESFRWERISLAADTEKVLAAIDGATQIMLLASPFYTEKFLGLRPERKDDIITANHANMCCCAGICGACSHSDEDGVTVRRCKCI